MHSLQQEQFPSVGRHWHSSCRENTNKQAWVGTILDTSADEDQARHLNHTLAEKKNKDSLLLCHPLLDLLKTCLQAPDAVILSAHRPAVQTGDLPLTHQHKDKQQVCAPSTVTITGHYGTEQLCAARSASIHDCTGAAITQRNMTRGRASIHERSRSRHVSQDSHQPYSVSQREQKVWRRHMAELVE